MKRRFRWWLSAVLLYLLSVPIIFIAIGTISLLIMNIYIVMSGLTGPGESAGFGLLYWYFMILVGLPLSILSSFFVPPLLLGWNRHRRLR